MLGLPIATPDGFGEALGLLFATVGAAFVAIFFVRLLYWPWGKVGEYRAMEQSDLIIRFHPDNESCVRIDRNIHGPVGEVYGVLLENGGSKTLEVVSIRALDSWFTEHTFGLSERIYRKKPVMIFELEHLHPAAPERVGLFGLGYGPDSANPDYIFNTVQQFVLEARAKDTKTVRRTFEFDPAKRPMIRMIDA